MREYTHGYSDKRGITLVALVITIIVLLILAGVAIRAIVGDNGVLKQSTKASKEHSFKAEVELADTQAIYIDSGENAGKIDLKETQKRVEALDEVESTTIKDGKLEIKFKDGKTHSIPGVYTENTSTTPGTNTGNDSTNTETNPDNNDPFLGIHAWEDYPADEDSFDIKADGTLIRHDKDGDINGTWRKVGENIYEITCIYGEDDVDVFNVSLNSDGTFAEVREEDLVKGEYTYTWSSDGEIKTDKFTFGESAYYERNDRGDITSGIWDVDENVIYFESRNGSHNDSGHLVVNEDGNLYWQGEDPTNPNTAIYVKK